MQALEQRQQQIHVLGAPPEPVLVLRRRYGHGNNNQRTWTETNMHCVTDEAPVRGQVQYIQNWPQTLWVWPFTGRAWLLRAWARMRQHKQLDPAPPPRNPTRSFDFCARDYRLGCTSAGCPRRTQRLLPGRHRAPQRGLPHGAQSARVRRLAGRWDGTPEEGHCTDRERSCQPSGWSEAGGRDKGNVLNPFQSMLTGDSTPKAR